MAAASAVPALSSEHSRLDTVRRNFAQAGAHLGLSAELAQVLSTSHRELRIEIPVWTDAGPLNAYVGYRVQHNGARGPFLGGLELRGGFGRETARAMAESMTWKAALLDIPFGGAAAGVDCDLNALSDREAIDLSRRFAVRLHHLLGQFRDILSPSMDLPSEAVHSMFSALSELHEFEAASFAGKPRPSGGLPGRTEAIAHGTAALIAAVLWDMGMRPGGVRVAVQGRSALTQALAESLGTMGATIVASDKSGRVIENQCDLLVLADPACMLHEGNARTIRARLVVEAADLLITPGADRVLESMNVIVIPDLIATGGGALCAYTEWAQNLEQVVWLQPYVEEQVRKGLLRAYGAVRDYAAREVLPLRTAAYSLGIHRVACMEKLRAA